MTAPRTGVSYQVWMLQQAQCKLIVGLLFNRGALLKLCTRCLGRNVNLLAHLNSRESGFD